MATDSMYCQTHHTKINSYCESCLDGICWRCYQKYHRGHKVHTFQDAFHKYQSIAINELLPKQQREMRDLENLRHSWEICLHKIEMNSETIKRRISNKFNSIIQALQKKETTLIDMVGKSTSQQILSCENEIDCVNKLQGNIEDLKLEAYNIAYSGKSSSIMMYKKLLNGMNDIEEDKNRSFQQKAKILESLCDYSLIHTDNFTDAIHKIDLLKEKNKSIENEPSWRQKGVMNTEKENKSIANLSRKRKLEEDDSGKDTLTSLRTKTAKLDNSESTGIGSPPKKRSAYLQKVLANRQKNKYANSDKKKYKSNENLASKRTSGTWPRTRYAGADKYVDVDFNNSRDKNTINTFLQQRSTVSYNDFDMFSDNYGNGEFLSMEKSFSFNRSKKREANFNSDSSKKSFKSVSASNKTVNEKLKEKMDTSNDNNKQKSDDVNKQTMNFEILMKRAEKNLKYKEDHEKLPETSSVTMETRSTTPESTLSTCDSISICSSASENSKITEHLAHESTEKAVESSKPATDTTQPVIKSEPVDTGYEKAQLVIKSEKVDPGYRETVVKTEPVDTGYEKQAHYGGIQVKQEPKDDYFDKLVTSSNQDGSAVTEKTEKGNESTLDESEKLANQRNNEELDMNRDSSNTDTELEKEKTSDNNALTGKDNNSTVVPEIKKEVDGAVGDKVRDSNNNGKLYDLNLTVTINNDCQKENSESHSKGKVKERLGKSPECSGNETKQLKKKKKDTEPELKMKTNLEADSKSSETETEKKDGEVIVIEDTDSEDDRSRVADSEVRKETDNEVQDDTEDEVQDDNDDKVQDDIDKIKDDNGDKVQDHIDGKVQDDFDDDELHDYRPIYDLNLTVTVNNDYQGDATDYWGTVEGCKSTSTQTIKTPTRSFGIQTETGKKLTDKTADNVTPNLGSKDNPITCDSQGLQSGSKAFRIKPIVWEPKPIKAQITSRNTQEFKKANTQVSFKSTEIGASVFGGKAQSSGDKITSTEKSKATRQQQVNCVTPFQAVSSKQATYTSQSQTNSHQQVVYTAGQQSAYSTQPQSAYVITPQLAYTTQPQSIYANQLPPNTTQPRATYALERPVAYTVPVNYNTAIRPDFTVPPPTRYTSQQPYQFTAESTTANFNFITPNPYYQPFQVNYPAGGYHVPTTQYRVGYVQRTTSVVTKNCKPDKLEQIEQQSKGNNHTETSEKDILPNKKSLLEEYKKELVPNLQLKDITNHVVEFSKDSDGSRFIQTEIQKATSAEISAILDEILTSEEIGTLIKHMFGSQVIQCLISNGSCQQMQILVEQLQDQIVPLSLHVFGHKVICMALITATQNLQLEILNELDGHVLKCAMDINGTHVIQTCIENVTSSNLQFILDACKDQVKTLSLHPYGYHVIQKIIEHGSQDVQLTAGSICEKIIEQGKILIHNQYGCHVLKSLIQHSIVLNHRTRLFSLVKDNVLCLSQHMFSGSVVEKCLTCLEPPQKALLVKEVCLMNEDDFTTMLTNKFSSSVVKTMLNVAKQHQRKVLMKKISTHLPIIVDDTIWNEIIKQDSKS